MNKTDKMVKSLFGSWKTTAAGVTGFIVLLGSQVLDALDDNPETTFDLGLVVMAFVALLTGAFAKDGDKSSKELGIDEQ